MTKPEHGTAEWMAYIRGLRGKKKKKAKKPKVTKRKRKPKIPKIPAYLPKDLKSRLKTLRAEYGLRYARSKAYKNEIQEAIDEHKRRKAEAKW